MWRADGGLANVFKRLERSVLEDWEVEGKETLRVLGEGEEEWEEEEERVEKAKATGMAEAAIAVVVVATDLRNAIFSWV